MINREHLHVLHVEDDAGDRDLFQLAIRKIAASVRTVVALDGEDALRILNMAPKSEPFHLPDFILLDLNLPKKDGRQFLNEIKQDPQLKGIPVIVFTTSNAVTDIENCYRQGAACYVVKPIDFNNLVLVVRRLVDFWQMVEPPRDSTSQMKDFLLS